MLSDPKKKTRYDNGHDMDGDGGFDGGGKYHFVLFFTFLVVTIKVGFLQKTKELIYLSLSK